MRLRVLVVDLPSTIGRMRMAAPTERSAASSSGLIRLLSVVTALAEDVRADGLDESSGALLVENDHGIHAPQSTEDLRAVGLVVDRAGGALELADGGIRVQSNDERIPEVAGLLEVASVAGVDEVKATAGED